MGIARRTCSITNYPRNRIITSRSRFCTWRGSWRGTRSWCSRRVPRSRRQRSRWTWRKSRSTRRNWRMRQHSRCRTKTTSYWTLKKGKKEKKKKKILGRGKELLAPPRKILIRKRNAILDNLEREREKEREE